jgi:hypothetical protein
LLLIIGFTLFARSLKRKRKLNLMTAQASLDRATGIIRSQDTVIGSAVLALAAVRKLYDDAIANLTAAGEVDTTELEAAAAEASARQSELATAIAASTPAATEVDGEGDDDDTVDPDEVDTSVVTDPAPEAGEGDEAKAGEGEGQQEG